MRKSIYLLLVFGMLLSARVNAQCVNDTTPPVITCGSTDSVNNDPGQCSAVVNLVPPAVSDNCALSVPVLDQSETTVNNTWSTGGYYVGESFTAGLSGVLGQISLNVNQAGTGSIEIRNGADVCGTLLFSGPANFNVGWNNYTISGVTVTAGNVYTINVLSSSGTVLNIFYNGGVAHAGSTLYWSNCGNGAAYFALDFKTWIGAVPLYNNYFGNNFPVGTTVVTWTATDSSGNVSTCNQNVVVTDNEKPTITCGGPVSTNADAGKCYATINLVPPVVTDNCGVSPLANPSVTSTNNTWNTGGGYVGQSFTAPTSGPLSKIRLNIRTAGTGSIEIHDGYDVCGPLLFSGPAIFNAGWNDYAITGVNVIAGNPYTIKLNTSNGTVVSLYQGNIPGGNIYWAFCGVHTNGIVFTFEAYIGVSGITNDHPGDTFNVGTTNVNWTVTDIHGNTNTCSQQVTVTANPLVITGASLVCGGTTDTLNAGVHGSYLWSTGDTTQSIVVTTTGTYNVTIHDGGTCVSSASDSVTIGTVPNATITPNPAVVCSTATLSVAGYGGTPFLNSPQGSGTQVTCNCPKGWVAVGYTGRNGGWLDQFSLACKKLNSNGTLGTTIVYTSSNGTSGGGGANGPYILPGNQALVGLTAFNGCCGYLSGVDGFGQTVSYIQGNGNNPVGATDAGTLSSGGSSLGTLWVPNGSVVIGMTSWNTFYAGGVSLNYAPINDLLHPVSITWSTGDTTSSIQVSTGGPYSVTVTNTAGCTSSSTDTVTVGSAPAIVSCPGNIIDTLGAGQCSAVIGFLAATASGIPAPVITYSQDSGSVFSPGVTTVTVTATNPCGTATCSFNVTVADTTAPVITCPGNMSVSTDPTICGAVVNFNVTATDLCGSVTLVSSPASGSVFAVGTTTVNSTATDFMGNTASCSFTVTVTDNTPPVIGGCPGDTSVYNDPGVCGAVVNFATPSATDNCGTPVNVSFSYTGGYQSWVVPAGVYSVTVDAGGASGGSDNNYGNPGGNGARVQATLAVTPGQTLYINVGGAGGTNGAGYNGGGTGGDDGFSDFGGGGGGLTNIGTTGTSQTDTLVVAGGGGGAGIDCGFELGGQGGGPNGTDGLDCFSSVGDGASQTGSNGNYQAGSFMQGANGPTGTSSSGGGGGGGYYGGGSDYYGGGGGGSSYASPFYNSNVTYTTGYNGGNGYVNLTYNTPFSTTQTAGPVSGSTFPVGTTTVTFSATDANNNTSTCSFNITVLDTIAPVISCPAPITLYTDPGLCTSNGFTATVNFPSGGGTNVGDWSPYVQNFADPLPAGAVVTGIDLTFTAQDQGWGGTGAPATMVVDGITIGAPPIYHTPTTNTINYSGSIPAYVYGGNNTLSLYFWGYPGWQSFWLGGTMTIHYLLAPAVTDNTCAVVSVVASPASPYSVGTTTVTWTATDASGNSSSCTQSVTVLDTTAPVITCPGNISVSNDAGVCGAVVNFSVTATDNCSATVVSTPASGTTFAIGTTTVTSVATDPSGNTDTCSFTVTVTDTSAPVITCPAALTLYTDPGLCTSNGLTATVNFPSGGGTNVSSWAPYVQNFADPLPTGAVVTGIDLTFTAQDQGWGGTGAGATMDVDGTTLGSPAIYHTPTTNTINYTGPIPGYTYGGNNTLNLYFVGFPGWQAFWDGGTMTIHYQLAPAVTDNCGVSSVTSSPAGPYSVGTTTVTWTATNTNGITSTCTQSVTVLDTTAPVITCPGNISVSNDAGVCGAVVNFSVTATDNCSATVVSTPASGTTFAIGTTTVTSVATDPSGNTATCSFTVTVTDTSAPVITCPAGIVTVTDPGSCQACNIILAQPPTVTIPATLDYADRFVTYTGVSINGGSNSAIVAPGSTVSLSYSMSVSFNSSTGYCPGCIVQSYIGIGGTSTIITCENSINNGYSNSYGGVTFTAPTQPGLYYLTQSGSLQFSCSTASFNNLPSNAIGVIQIGPGQAQATDNCGIASVTSDAPGCFNVGTTTVTWTATDINGNTSTCTQTVTVSDTTAPVITCPGNISVSNDPGVCGAVVNFSVTATDNCSATIVSTPASGTTFAVGTTTVTSVATDPSGNTATCSFTVTVTDTSGPAITCPANIAITGLSNATASGCGRGITILPPATQDICGIATVTNSFNHRGNASGIYPVGITHITWTATDVNNLSASCTQIVTVYNCIHIAGTVSNTLCAGTSNGNIVLAVTGGTTPYSYTWNTGAHTPNLIGIPAGTYTVTVTDTTQGSATASFVVGTSTPARPNTPGAISGVTTACPGSTDTFSIVAVAGATSYNWTTASNMIILSGQGSRQVVVRFLSNFGTGAINVTASNCAGSSRASSLLIRLPAAPLSPASITGPATVCDGDTATFISALVAGATGYTWFAPPNASIVAGQGTAQVLITFHTGFRSGNVEVYATNCAGHSAFRTHAVNTFRAPGKPASVSGMSKICPDSVYHYSIAPVANATSYLWTVPALCNLLSGQGTTSITIQSVAGFVSGTILVRASNCAGTGPANGIVIRHVVHCGMAKMDESDGETLIDQQPAPIFTAEVYPNPFSDQFHLKIESSSDAEIALRIFDITGQLVSEKKESGYKNDVIFGENLASGMYIIQVQQGDNIRALRIIKTK